MSYRHEDLVDQNSKATGLARGLLKKIARHINDKDPGNSAYVGYRALARSIGIREEDGRWPKEIEREQMMPQLFDLGELECAEGAGPRRTNVYFLLEPIIGPAHPAWPQCDFPQFDDDKDEVVDSPPPRKRTKKAKAKEDEPEIEEWRCTCDVPPGKHPSNTECKIWKATDIEASLVLEKAQAHKDGKERQAQEEHNILERTRAELARSRQAATEAEEAADYGDLDEEAQLKQNQLDAEEDEERWARQEAEEDGGGLEDDDDDL